ncbi:MAG: DNA-binding protein WhiA [Acholeplasmatales bacterium]|nr:DNA-binding protein WhiA [Acholeplasmatales bacterium]
MSFALDVKNDLLKVNNTDSKAAKLELEAMLRFGGEVILARPMRLSFTCNNMGVIRRFIKICKSYYKIEYEISSRVINRFDNHTVFTCMIINGADSIITELNLIGSQSILRESDLEYNQYAAYLRGAFLVRGSVNDPASRGNHLEIITISENEILYIQKIMNYFELNARIIKRKNYLVAYIKSKDSIGDFLYRIGATSIMTYYEDINITKEIKATAKRTVNLEIANQDKTNAASQEQLKYIKYLEYNYPLEQLDSKILMIMKVRKEHPEHSLTELLYIIHDEYDPKLTKSGLNHRLRKIKELALEHQEKKKIR